MFKFLQFFKTNFFLKNYFFLILFAVFNVLFVGYSLAKNNLNNTYQYNMISKNFPKTMNYVLNYINKIQSESFFVPASVFQIKMVLFLNNIMSKISSTVRI
jgi:hypothetical protein